MKHRVIEREKYEKKTLSEYSEWEELDFFKFVDKDPYGNKGPRRDTFYDALLYSISIDSLICWNETTLTIKILGPFWDRVFKSVFTDVTNLKFKEKYAWEFDYIYSVKLKKCSKNKYKCIIKDFHKNKILQFKFENVILMKAILNESIERAPT